MSGAVDHLAMAKQYPSEAFKFLEREDPFDACEKIWAAVKHATTALAMRILGEVVPPRGVSWRSFVKETFLKAGLSEEEASKWASYFIDVRSRIHGDCFYGLMYEEEEHRSLMEKAREYIDFVDKILKKLEC